MRPVLAVAALAAAALLAGCVVPPPPVAPPPPPGPDAALARDAALAAVSQAAPGLGSPVLVHAPGAGGPVDVATLALPDAVLFDFGVSVPRPGSAPVIEALARAVASSPPGTVVTVAGNTDAVGSDDYNQALSEARARNVVLALAEAGIDPGRLRAVGFGRHRPVATNDTPEGRALNRRVEVALSPSFAANAAAFATEVPLVATVPDAQAPTAPPAPAAADPSALSARRPAPLQIRPNRPSAVRPNPLGPSMSY